MPQFDDQSARRISRTVRGWERRQQGRQSQRGRWHGRGGGGRLYWCMLMEDHPGPDTCFKIILGEWSDTYNGWEFDCDTPQEEWETAVDYHYGAPEPDMYACGWFEQKKSTTTTSGYIYVVVSLDCVSRGECKSTVYATGCGEEEE